MPATRTVATRLGGLAALLVIASTLAACSTVARVAGPREWTQELGQADGGKQTIVVRDTSGRIENVEIDPVGIADPGVIANPGAQPNVVLVPWTGGACDSRTEIEFAAAGEGLKGTLKITTTGDMCIMLAVPHVLRLTTIGAMPAGTVTLEPVAIPQPADG
jgi:hypothetical protein